MAKTHEWDYPSADGEHRVYVKEWRPEAGEPKAVLQIVHGVAEYIGRYDEFARYLADRGIAVAGGDHLGHGRTASDGRYGRFPERHGWQTVVNDVHALQQLLADRYPGIPRFLLGHSMGSLLARQYLLDWPGTVSGAILSGTLQMPSALTAAGTLLAGWRSRRLGSGGFSPTMHKLSFGSYNRQFKPTRTHADWISRDPAVVDAYVSDPLCQFPVSVGLIRDMLGGLRYVSDPPNLRKMDPRTPIYLFAGSRDPVGGNGAGVRKTYRLFRDAGCVDVTLKLYPEGRHEMLNETNREEVYADTLAWLEKHL